MRKLLLKAVESEGLKLTAKGNLSRSVVNQVVDLFWSEREIARHFQYCKVLNEGDVGPLIKARHMLMFSGLLKKRKGALVVPKSRRRLLEPERAGELAAILFTTHFTKFNLGFATRYPEELLTIQHDAGYVLFTLGRQAREWLAMDAAPETLLHPNTFAQLQSAVEGHPFLTVSYALKNILLSPFASWGLIDPREQENRYHLTEWTALRVTPFYDQWIRFDSPS